MSLSRSGQFLGRYGTEAGGVIEFEWVPDPIVFSERILEVKDDLQDRTVPLAISRGILAHDVKENFEGEHDPEGTPWAPWSSAFDADGNRQLGEFDPVTDKWSKKRLGYGDRLPPGHSGKILNWRGILKAAATSESAYVQISGQSINEDSLFFDTGGLPPYWVYHQQPESPNSGKFPQRRFLGMSGEAEIQILEAFDGWFQGILEKAVSSKGRTFARYRDPVTKRFMRNPNA